MLFRTRYEIVVQRIKEMVMNGELKEGDKLPSEIEFSKKLGVSRATLREAFRILEDEGLIKRYHGVGTFVSKIPVIKSGMEELASITKLIENQGMKPGTKDVVITRVRPSEREASMMGLFQDEEIYRVERVRTADGIPVLFCIDRIPARFVKKEFKLDKESLFDYLQDDLGIYISYAVSDVIPVKAEVAGVYKKLNLRSKSGVVLLLEQLHYDEKDKPIFYSSNFFSPEKFRFYIVRRRI
ncbi:GntR family transcriptional regulator [Thermosediminibacter oceani]|uniref:Transcriptional regulator, GntR family n=1 Tax=Thermosediminibacter oceani (strain ATCC BAA-1034 / DSM 16646 / JW/IW-1228P) TaxID=555079 RepID=D9S1T7_THEOJ|nr:GntR family transcriptional regulator [Thermosediminibacter oceani]ADL07364.1 transcriptional regulator, GntR family [Thermosediminibacter oceani DSM 16646]